MKISGQFVRYAIVGLISNGVLYLAYLVLTWLGLGHKFAMTLLYVVGVLQTFVFNRNWTFKHGGLVGAALTRYAVAYGFGYLLNFAALALFVDVLQSFFMIGQYFLNFRRILQFR